MKKTTTPSTKSASTAKHELVGQKVNLKKIRVEDIVDKKDYSYTAYEVDDAAMQEKFNLLGSMVRVFTPGKMGTMDFQPARVNVYIDKTGKITKVSNG